MLVVIYTKDEAGNCVVPFVEETQPIVSDLLKVLGADDVISVPPNWFAEGSAIREQLESVLTGVAAKLVFEEEAGAVGVNSSDTNSANAVTFYDDTINEDQVDSYIEICLAEGSELFSTMSAPHVNMKQFVFHRSTVHGGITVTHWKRTMAEVEFSCDEEEVGAPDCD